MIKCKKCEQLQKENKSLTHYLGACQKRNIMHCKENERLRKRLTVLIDTIENIATTARKHLLEWK